MPRPSGSAQRPRPFRPLALLGAVTIAVHLSAEAQSAPPAEPAAEPNASPPLKLRLDRALSETRQSTASDAATYARAQRIEGTVNERIVLEGDAEVRRSGTVLRGDRIIYTQATDQVDVEGHARIFRQGASFSGPQLSFRIDAQTGQMPDATFTYAPRGGRGQAALI